MSKLPTPGECIRRECLNCLCAQSAFGAFDCLSRLCKLYPAHPFRGKHIPKGQRPRNYDEAAEEARMAAHHKKFPARLPSRKIIRAHCYDCQPEFRDDCGATHCGLYPLRPWQPGGQPKQQRSAAQRKQAETLAAGARGDTPDPPNSPPNRPGASGPTDGPPGLFSGENWQESAPISAEGDAT